MGTRIIFFGTGARRHLRVFFLILLVMLGFITGTRLAIGGVLQPYSLPRILIDPGHGGIDGGCGSSVNILEKEINLAVGLRLFKQLKRYGVVLDMTRYGDRRLGTNHRRDLQSRVAKAESFRADVVVSLHIDWSRKGGESGPRVFYCRGSKKGLLLAESVQEELNYISGSSNAPQPTSSLFVLREVKKPAILIEMGFLSNASDRGKLVQADFQENLAEAIAIGVIRFFL